MKRRLKWMALAAAAAVLSLLAGCGSEPRGESVKDMLGETIQEGQSAPGQPSAESAGKLPAGKEDSQGQEDSGNQEASENRPTGSAGELFPDESGTTLETRVKTPRGFERTAAEEGSFARYLRQFPMKEPGAKVHLYDGSEKGNQRDHAAVFDLPIENYDLQQCADSVMRMYAEYFWNSGQTDRIAFHFTNGFLAEYSKWRDGMRIQVSGNDVSWTPSASYDDSYECFVKYLKIVFTYAGTLSMNGEAQEIGLEEIAPGDVFLVGGSPGHVVMVVDVCENAEGEKAFLLGQGYMPAQEFHLLKNGLHEDDPWYYVKEVKFPLVTPGYTFPEGSLKRLNYFREGQIPR